MANMADLMVHIGADTDELTSSIDSAVSTVSEKMGKLGIGVAGAGAGLEGFARSQQDTNYALERMGRVTGDGSGAMRDMANDLQNVTFPMEDVTALMETATERGLKGEGIADYANFWDMVGDATGEAGPVLGEAGVALGQVGIAAGEEAEALDAFGYITDNTTGSVEGFLSFIERTGTEIDGATPSVDEMAGALGVLEDNGYTAERAQRELRTELSAADGDMSAALETLGISEQAYADQVSAVEKSSGAIESNADAYAETKTPLQEMQANVENLMTKYGGLGEAAGMVAAPLTGVGTAMMGASMVLPTLIGGVRRMVTGLITATTTIWSKIAALGAWAGAMVAQGARAVASMVVTATQFAVQWTMMAARATANGVRIAAVWTAQIIASAARGAASMAVAAARVVGGWVLMGAQAMLQAARMAAAWLIAMGPIGWIITAVVGLVALIIANWDKVKAWTITAWNAVVNFITNAWDNITSWVSNAVANVGNFVQSGWNKVKSWTSAAWDAVLGFITGAWDSITSWISNAISNAASFVQDGWNKVKSWTSSIWNGIVSWIGGIPGKILSGLAAIGRLYIQVGQWILSVKDAAVDKFMELIDYVGGIPGKILDGLGDLGSLLYDGGANIIQGLIDGIGSMVGNIGDAIGGAVDTVKDFLPWSPAKKGPLRKNRPEDGGRNIVDMIAGGMADGESGVISEAERIAQAASVSAPDVPGPRVPGTGRVDAAGSDRDSQGSGNTTISIDMRGARMDSDKRVKQLSQDLNTRIQRSDRSRGRVSLEGVTR